MTYLHFSEKSVKGKVFGMKDVVTCWMYDISETVKNISTYLKKMF